MEAFKGYYNDEKRGFLRTERKGQHGSDFYQVEWICKNGFVRTERTVFFSNSDIKKLKLN